MSEFAETIDFETFSKLDMRVARVLEVNDHPNADKLMLLKIDLGTEQRQLVAGLKGHYQPGELIGKDIIVVVNLAPRKMRGELSQGMLLAAVTDDQAIVRVLTTAGDVPAGSRVS
ncbi:MAG: methionine--tRNA ligase subunit beta [Phycisphaerales bacterium]|nr:MAG: methionine--tRNA ligase subunit beta [Phycisphaerales bacterium]